MTWSKITISGVEYPIKNNDQFTVIRDEWTSAYDGKPIESITFSAELENGDIVIGLELEKGSWRIVKHSTCQTCGSPIKTNQDVKRQ